MLLWQTIEYLPRRKTSIIIGEGTNHPGKNTFNAAHMTYDLAMKRYFPYPHA